MIQDPAGLLIRLPELEPLCEEPGVRRAIERGEPFAVYRALWWARLTGKLRGHREALSLLLRTRRAFARPLKGKLWLGTFNGFGATLMGSDEAEPDGSRIAVHWVVALFAAPLFPLGAYVVSGGERSGLSSSWNVYARVPLGLGTWAWSRGVALAIALAVAWAGGAALWASRHHDLTVVNGLAVPLVVQVGAASASVPANGRATLELSVGRWPARATAPSGAAVDALDLEIRSGSARLLWNVAGAAPIYEETNLYTKEGSPNAQAPEPRLHCGERQVVAERVDDFFQEPPRQVSMGKYDNVVVRRHLDVAREENVEGAVICAYLLADRDRSAEALQVAEARAVTSGWAEADADLAVAMAFLVSPAEHERVARTAMAARPGEISAVRDYQYAMEGAGKRAELLAQYARAAAASPDDPRARYLHVRLLEGTEGREAVDAALGRFPADPDLLRVAVAVRVDSGDWAGAVQAYRALKAASPAATGRVLEPVAVALVAQGRIEEARAELAAAAKALAGRQRIEAVALHVRVSALASGRVDEALVRTWEETLGGPQPHLRAQVGLPSGDGLSGADAMEVALGSDPARALEMAGTLPRFQLALLGPEAWALAYYEAMRSGAATAGRLAAHHFFGLRSRPTVLAYVRGEPVDLPEGLPLQLRAAARLVRSRVAGLGAGERQALLAAARADDPLGGIVTRAARAWPAAR